VRAEIQPENGVAVTAFFWSNVAPSAGSRVVVVGREMDGAAISVETWRYETSTTAGFELRLLAFLRACVEAESTEGLRVARDSRNRVFLTEGDAPVVGGVVTLDDNRDTTTWARRRVTAGGAETLIAGWPVVTGTRMIDDRRVDVVAPLLFCEVTISADEKRFVLEPAQYAVELNPEALALLGVDRDEREWAVALVDELPGSLSMAERTQRLLDSLRDAGILSDSTLDAHALGPLVPGERVHNTAVCFVSDGDRAAFVRGLLRDLSELSTRRDEELAAGPLGVLLGRVPAGEPIGPEPMPVVVATNAEQEHAVASAMRSPFTVVTGPPGTGKTQVLVDVAAAAVAAGETVLLASKNNHAINVVADRLREINDEAEPVRTGKRSEQQKAAAGILRALGRPTVAPGDLTEAKARWESGRRAALPAYEQLVELDGLERERDASKRAFAEHIAGLPAGLGEVSGSVERDVLVAAHQKAVRMLDEVDRLGSGWFRGRRRRRLAAAADAQVGTTIGQFDGEAQRALTDVLLRSGPRAALASVADALQSAELRDRVARAQRAFDLAPTREVAWKAVDGALLARPDEGNAVVAAVWRERLRAGSPSARALAETYAHQVAAATARMARASMPGVLEAFPVWAVTSLATGTNLPLEQGLFDLVVIDEASQSDLASAIPLLFRAKRALIVGDPNQLTHITSVSDRADEQLAERHGLTDDEHSRFSYKSTSLFAAAERASGRQPMLLRQHYRSHPDIVGFSNREIYGGRLVVRTAPERLLPGRAFEWCDVVGPWERNNVGRSVRKRDEAEVVLDELERQWKELEALGRDIGIVTPFRAQVDLLSDRLGERLPDLLGKVTIDTAYGFQGDERDVMVFSLAIADDLPGFTMRFAGDPHLVNVAVTRARSRLVVVGDHTAALGSGTLLSALARSALDLGAVVRR
jgi:hypothetical protein